MEYTVEQLVEKYKNRKLEIGKQPSYRNSYELARLVVKHPEIGSWSRLIELAGDKAPDFSRKREITYEVDENGCHNCTSHYIGVGGYPVITLHDYYEKDKDRKLTIHRYLYMKEYGELPSDIVIRHKCDNRRCINLEHLEPGTHQDNINDMVSRGRNARGEKFPHAKLTDEQAISVWNDPRVASVIAEEYGVDISVVYQIKRGISRKYLGLGKYQYPVREKNPKEHTKKKVTEKPHNDYSLYAKDNEYWVDELVNMAVIQSTRQS